MDKGAMRPSFSAANGPHVVVVVLIVVVHVAVVQVHVPGVVRVVRVGSTGPVVVRLDAAKSVHFSRQTCQVFGNLTGLRDHRQPIPNEGYDSLYDHAALPCSVGGTDAQ